MTSVPVRPGDVLDAQVLGVLQALGSRPGMLLRELCRTFLLETPVAVADMAAAVEVGDRASVPYPAHKLRGSSGHLGAKRLVAVCAALESTAPYGNRSQMDDLIGRLRHESALALEAVQALMGVPVAACRGSSASTPERTG